MEIIQPLIAVVAVLGLLVLVLFALRKRGIAGLAAPPPGRRKIEVIERVTLTPQHVLHLVRAGDRCLLIATAPSSCQVIETISGQGT